VIAKQTSRNWLAFHKPNPAAKVSLFCFPYAGGTASMFQQWRNGLPDTIEVCPVQLPGRGHRLSEPRFTNLGPLVASLAEEMGDYLDRPFAFFGHSMGALITFELARLLRRKGKRQPVHIFVSGCDAPQCNRPKPIYDLPEPELLEELRGMNGTPQEVLDHAELMELMLPIIRDDLSVCQTYEYSPEPPLSCDITAFGGLQDPGVSEAAVNAWREQTTGTFAMKMIEGDHFFIHNAIPQVLKMISTRSQAALSARRG